MVAVPMATPVTIPDEVPTVAIVVPPLLQVPPPIELCSAVVPPGQTLGVPVIGATGLTVIVAVTAHPPGEVYLITEVPAVNPLTTPVDSPIVATVVLPLVHVPPPVASLRVMVLPWQTDVGPEIAGTAGRTVAVVVIVHPAGVV